MADEIHRITYDTDPPPLPGPRNQRTLRERIESANPTRGISRSIAQAPDDQAAARAGRDPETTPAPAGPPIDRRTRRYPVVTAISPSPGQVWEWLGTYPPRERWLIENLTDQGVTLLELPIGSDRQGLTKRVSLRTLAAEFCLIQGMAVGGALTELPPHTDDILPIRWAP